MLMRSYRSPRRSKQRVLMATKTRFDERRRSAIPPPRDEENAREQCEQLRTLPPREIAWSSWDALRGQWIVAMDLDKRRPTYNVGHCYEMVHDEQYPTFPSFSNPCRNSRSLAPVNDEIFWPRRRNANVGKAHTPNSCLTAGSSSMSTLMKTTDSY